MIFMVLSKTTLLWFFYIFNWPFVHRLPVMFQVTTLLNVHVCAQIHDERSTNVISTTTLSYLRQETWKEHLGTNVPVENVTDLNKETTKEHLSTTIDDAVSYSKVSQSIIDKQTTSVSDTLSVPESVDTTKPTTTVTKTSLDSQTKQAPRTDSKITSSQSLEMTFVPTGDNRSSTSTDHVSIETMQQTTTTKGEEGSDSSNTVTKVVEETTSVPHPGLFFKWLNPDNFRKFNLSKENHTHLSPDSFDPDVMPPEKFMEWLNSIHPDNNTAKSATVTIKNIIDTTIITTEKLIVVICTICGSFVLFVVVLIIVSCCRRNSNVRSDSEKSDFSMTSVASVISLPDKQKQDVFSTGKNGYNDLFMGIPTNNAIWKDLDQLPPSAPSVMPESTRL